MRRAAGAPVEALRVDDPDASDIFQLFAFGAVVERAKLVRLRIIAADRHVGAYGAVGFAFRFFDLLLREDAVYIKGHVVRAEMEADVVKSIKAVNGAAEQVLAEMILHFAEALLKVERAVHGS